MSRRPASVDWFKVNDDLPRYRAKSDVYEHLESKGVKFTLLPTSRQNEGTLLAVAVDPYGLEISFAQQLKRKVNQGLGGKGCVGEQYI